MIIEKMKWNDGADAFLKQLSKNPRDNLIN